MTQSHDPRRLLPTALWLLLALTPALAQAQEPETVPEWEQPVQLELAPGVKKELQTVIVLNSGEALRGELIRLSDGDLVYESDELGELNLDLDDVRSIRSRQRFAVQVRGGHILEGEKLEGRVRLEGKWLTIYAADDTVMRLAREDLVSIYPDYGEVELDKWRIKLSLQASASFGNTRNSTLLVTGTAKRRSGDWLFRVDGELTQSQANKEEFEKARQGKSQLDWDFSQLTFLTTYFVDARYDKFQNLSLRMRAGSGGGLRLIRQRDVEWTLEGAPAFTYTVSRRTEPGEERTSLSVALRVASRYEIELLNGDLDLSLLVESYVGLQNVKDTTHQVRAQIGYDLFDHWTVNLSLSYDRIENPQRNANGERPKRDDFLIGVGFGFDFP